MSGDDKLEIKYFLKIFIERSLKKKQLLKDFKRVNTRSQANARRPVCAQLRRLKKEEGRSQCRLRLNEKMKNWFL